MSSRRRTHGTAHLPSGTTLEYMFSSPDAIILDASGAVSNKLAICLHPWSWLGGRMDDPVLQLLSVPLNQKGYHILRYNSRGVGKSTGWPSLSGSREVQDLQELVQWALGTISPVTSVAIIGYSYGSLIASSMPALPNIKTSHVLLSYPLGPRHWLTAFRGKTYTAALRSLVQDPHSNVLVLHGDHDDFTSSDVYAAWAQSLVADETNNQGRLEVVQIEHGSHFWREEQAKKKLLEVVSRWLP
ncbi:alpha/beta-hydrolase [Obba rivulosa]|uniref:Alpha/beta-hydrolase n=1 Tax=Obba rivulosa TaxID=1052685 RepID=A0A8E2DIU2_9APHY|nr:alpha/beta-hydrolase [Obba rivulosa]